VGRIATGGTALNPRENIEQNVPVAAAAESRRAGGNAAREGVLEVPGSFTLHHGGELSGLRLAWRLAGPSDAPVVLALGGISATRRVFLADSQRPGWWNEIAGPGRALDSTRLRILGIDYLGGSGESSRPIAGGAFPSLSSYDQAEAVLRLLNHLGIKSLRAIVGASYGGMIALAFGERYADRVERLVVISAADCAHPMATAWRSVQRSIVRLGIGAGNAGAGMELARALAMSTYRSPEEFAARFRSAPRELDGRMVFPVEEYLFARGRDYAARYLPESFICLSESIDLHRVDATRVGVPTEVVAVREDQLVPLADMRALAARLPDAHFHELSSLHGHDAFLKEAEQLKPILAILSGDNSSD
jgi:homoserine O-acetyltransferase/O-succinyltransferase